MQSIVIYRKIDMGKIFKIIPILFLFACQVKNNTNGKAFGISIITADKTTTLDGITRVDSTGINIIYQDNFIIYKTQNITYRESKDTIIGDTIFAGFINPDTSYRHFVIERNNDSGLYYDEDKTKMAMSFSLDSLLKATELHPSKLRVYSLELGLPTEVFREKNTIIEKYLNKKKAVSDPDSIYRYFSSNFSKIDFSYSPSLDQKANSKLIKTSFVNIYDNKQKKDDVVRTEFYSEMKKVNIQFPNEFIRLIKQYNKDKKIEKYVHDKNR